MINKNKVPDGWEKDILGNLFDITSSKRVFMSEWKSEGVPFYRAREIVKLSEEGFVDNELFISEEMFKEYSEKYGIPQEGDIMVTGVGTLGIVYIVKKEDKFYFKDGNIIWLKTKNKIASKYVDYFFKTNFIKRQIHDKAGAVVGTYTITKAKNTKIIYPKSPKEQEIIVEKLDCVSDAIKFRSECIKNTEELIPSIFNEMFGDPIKNEKGWNFIELGNKKYLSIEDGDRGVNYPKKEEFQGQGYCMFLNGKNVTNKGFVFDEIQFISEEKDVLLRKGKLKRNDLVVMTRGTIGNICLYSNDIPFSIVRINSGMVALRVTNKLDAKFLNYAFQNKYVKTQIKNIVTGAAVPQLPIHSMSRIKIPLPPLPLQQEFAEKAREIEAYLESQRKELKYFKKLFESLLQCAFNGSLTEKFRTGKK
ncbi:MAG: restriction endonuclease subunit S [Alphaproteobacteria bacterium]|nr:restriction endonuclease subunit S [Alphaproteobacteria bacterium]